MERVLHITRWVLFIAYAIGGAVALMMASPRGLNFLGLPIESLTFLPAKIMSLPWSLVPWLIPLDPVTTLALLAVGYMFNVGVGRMLAG
ncbi:MAG: hypothetical protein ACK4FG_00155 [Brevundimonas sp.]